MSRVNRYERFDVTSLKPPVRMDNGFLRVEGHIARTGIQLYRKNDGTMYRELRLPEEVFHPDSLASFAQLPVTNRHPPGMLTAANAKKYAVGSVGENVRADGQFVAAPLMLTDKDAIEAAEAGRSQLSNGYSCTLDETKDPALVAKWGDYDAIQRNIRGNHVALVDIARAGPDARLRLDSADASAGFKDIEDGVLLNTQEEHVKMPHRFKLDGLDIEVGDANTQAIIERVIEKQSARADAAEKSLAEATAQRNDAVAKLEVLKGRSFKCDALNETMSLDDLADETKRAAWLSKRDAAVVKDGVSRRVALLERARKVLPTNIKLDAMSDLDIKRALVKQHSPHVPVEQRDEAAINSMLEAVPMPADEPRPIDALRSPGPAVTPKADSEPSATADEARARMEARNRAAFVK